MTNARTADFAATAPWEGITGKPAAFPASPATLARAGALPDAVLVWDASLGQWAPLTLQQLKAALNAIP